MFTDAQKDDIRRFCGYGVFGAIPTQGFGYRFFQVEGTLEYRMNNLTLNQESIVINVYLTNLYTMESAIWGSGANLDTDEAAVWKHNKNEVKDRDDLFNLACRKLCNFFRIPPGPGVNSGGGIRIVV